MNRYHLLILLGCLLLLHACSVPQQPPPSTQPALTGTPDHLPISMPASVTPQPSTTLSMTSTFSFTATPFFTTTPSFSATPKNSPTPLPNQRYTPFTLMLHRPSTVFDSVAFLDGFIDILREEKMRVVTYRDLSKNPDLTATDNGRLFIITIDDVYLRYPIAPEILQMIALLKEAGYPAVLSVITEDEYAYPETVATLTGLSALGWEIASHTDIHINLLELQKIAPKAIYPEVKDSLDKLETAMGLRPITLMLPYGQMTNGDEQIKRTKVKWVVGINGGETYEMTAAYYYVGRESPAGSSQETYKAMQQRFGK